MIILTPAKINFGLKVINKRSDGFHNLETIFYPVSIYDKLTVNIRPSSRASNTFKIRTNNRVIPLDKSNICFKTVVQFLKAFNIKEYYDFEIFIEKNIPVLGGLGGGSSNAAAVIKICLKYFNIDVRSNKEKILDLALNIGSDVPFFMVLKPCLATGRGEKMKLLPEFTLKDYKLLLVNAGVYVSTRWAFSTLNLQGGEVRKSSLSQVTQFEKKIFNLLENDFEKIVFEKYPELGTIKKELIKKGAVFASLSGTGSTVYGVFNKVDVDKLQEAQKHFTDKKYRIFITE
ncbi:MAG: 4-(cytidine 5'-diphospho)-2-C-methyl-D-erythritol kinase [Ignavibacteria bacterium]